MTNRTLCQEHFLSKVQQLAEGTKYQAILLREKDLPQEQYEQLAKQVLNIMTRCNKKCILHFYPDVAVRLKHPYLHLPLPVWEQMPEERRHELRNEIVQIGTSVHSPEQLKKAVSMKADYVIAGHVFPTECKKGLAPRGVGFLHEICKQSRIPVYAIGGITQEREELVRQQGADGVCYMSAAMR